MADLQIARPAAGQQAMLNNVADARLVLGFAPDEAVLSREGDNLVFSFADGGKVALENFCTAYSSESLPDFEIEGLDIAGSDFFAALDPSLMPAADPAATAAQAVMTAMSTPSPPSPPWTPQPWWKRACTRAATTPRRACRCSTARSAPPTPTAMG